MTTDFAFALGLITSCLQVIAVACSWVLSSYFGRRTIYLYGTAANITFLFALGIAATVTQSSKAQFAQACLGVIISFTFALTLGPISYTIIAETSSVRLRPLSTAVGRAAYYIAEIPCIYRKSSDEYRHDVTPTDAAYPSSQSPRKCSTLPVGTWLESADSSGEVPPSSVSSSLSSPYQSFEDVRTERSISCLEERSRRENSPKPRSTCRMTIRRRVPPNMGIEPF